MRKVKRILATALVTALACSLLPLVAVAASDEVTATPVTVTVYIDGEAVEFPAIEIGGRYHFNLRDVAYALSGTAAQFDVTGVTLIYTVENEGSTWTTSVDNADDDFFAWGVVVDRFWQFNLINGIELELDGGEMERGLSGNRTALPVRGSLSLSEPTGEYSEHTLWGYDGERTMLFPVWRTLSTSPVRPYNIDGSHYFSLLHLGRLLHIDVQWDGASGVYLIDTGVRNINPQVLDSITDFLSEFTSIFSFGSSWRGDESEYLLRFSPDGDWMNRYTNVRPLVYAHNDSILISMDGHVIDGGSLWNFAANLMDPQGNEISNAVFMYNGAVAIEYRLIDINGNGIPDIFILFEDAVDILDPHRPWERTPNFVKMYSFIGNGFQHVYTLDSWRFPQFFLDHDNRIIVGLTGQKIWNGGAVIVGQIGDDTHWGLFEFTFESDQVTLNPMAAIHNRISPRFEMKPVGVGIWRDGEMVFEYEYMNVRVYDLLYRNYVTGEEVLIGEVIGEIPHGDEIARWLNHSLDNLGTTLVQIQDLTALQDEITQTVRRRLGLGN